MRNHSIQDLSPMWFWVPMGFVMLQLAVRFFSPEMHDRFIQGETETGLIELMTPVALIPGVVFGIRALRLWELLPNFSSREVQRTVTDTLLITVWNNYF